MTFCKTSKHPFWGEVGFRDALFSTQNTITSRSTIMQPLPLVVVPIKEVLINIGSTGDTQKFTARLNAFFPLGSDVNSMRSAKLSASLMRICIYRKVSPFDENKVCKEAFLGSIVLEFQIRNPQRFSFIYQAPLLWSYEEMKSFKLYNVEAFDKTTLLDSSMKIPYLVTSSYLAGQWAKFRPERRSLWGPCGSSWDEKKIKLTYG